MVTTVSRQPGVSASPEAQRTRSLSDASASLRNESISISRWNDGSNSGVADIDDDDDEENEESSEGEDSLRAMQEL